MYGDIVKGRKRTPTWKKWNVKNGLFFFPQERFRPRQIHLFCIMVAKISAFEIFKNYFCYVLKLKDDGVFALFETLPRNNLAVAPRPLLPTMIKLHCSFFANFIISFAMFPSFRTIFESIPCLVAIFFPVNKTLFPTFLNISRYAFLSNGLIEINFSTTYKSIRRDW